MSKYDLAISDGLTISPSVVDNFNVAKTKDALVSLGRG